MPDRDRGGPRHDVASDRGAADGYDAGLEDGRRGERFDPGRSTRYRAGDAGYDARYGSREDYRQQYRRGFETGYERGYRDGEQYRRRGDTRGSRQWPWPF